MFKKLATEYLQKLDFSISNVRTAQLICIGIALVIWIFLKLDKNYVTSRTIQLEYELPPIMEFTQTPPSALGATLNGSGFDLAKKSLVQRNPTITIDLTKYENREIQRNELIIKIEAVTSLDVKDINRNYIRFVIDSTATKKVPVKLDLKISYKTDFYLRDSIKSSTDSVLLSGSAKELAGIEFVETQPVVFNVINKDQKRTVPIKSSHFKTIEVIPESIELNVLVEQYTQKTLEVPVKVVHSFDSVQVVPSTVQVNCSVGLSRYDQLTKKDFLVEANFTKGVKLGTQKSVPVYLKEKPIWVRAPRLYPKTVDFLIIK